MNKRDFKVFFYLQGFMISFLYNLKGVQHNLIWMSILNPFINTCIIRKESSFKSHQMRRFSNWVKYLVTLKNLIVLGLAMVVTDPYGRRVCMSLLTFAS